MLEYNWTDELYHYGRKGMKWYQSIFGKKNAVNTKASIRADRKRNEEWAKDVVNNNSEKKIKEMYVEENAKANRLRGKAYGTGSLAMGNYKPPKEMSDEQFSKYLHESDKHYDRADELLRQYQKKTIAETKRAYENLSYKWDDIVEKDILNTIESDFFDAYEEWYQKD